MRVIVLGSGPTDPIIGKDSRLQSSVLIDNKLLIDATPSVEEQLSSVKNVDIRAVLITHAHKDCILGLSKLAEFTSLEQIPIYAFSHTIKLINKRIKRKSHLKFFIIEPNKVFEVEGYKILPIEIEHSVLQPKFDPTAAYKINDKLLYASDVDYEFFFSDRAKKFLSEMKKVALVMLDGAMCKGRLRGHLNIFEAADYLSKKKISNVLFTQVGRSCISIDLDKKLKEYGMNYSVAYDGQVLELAEDKAMKRKLEGLYLVEPHAKMIWQGNKDLIVKSVNFKDTVGNMYYLIGGNNCYGIIKIKKIKPINLKEFRELEHRHRISEQERTEWWPHKKVLFAYEFDIVKKFEEPKAVLVPQGIQTFVKDVKFLDRLEALIEDVIRYNPGKLPTEVLVDDFRILLAWYSTKKKGKQIKVKGRSVSIEDIENLLELVVRELLKRGIKFHPEKMKPLSREIFEKVMRRIKKNEMLSSKPKFLDKFKDATIIKDFISLIGSSVTNKDYNDIDLLIRMREPSDYLRRAIEVRIAKMFGELADKLHFVWGDPEGPHDVFIPLYDLKIERQNPVRVISMSENIAPLVPFESMKPQKRFYDVRKLAEYLYQNGQEKYAVEEKFDGFRVFIHRKGKTVKIYSEQKKDITFAFPTIVDQAFRLSEKNFILDGELVPHDEKGKPLGRRAAMKFIGAVKSKKKVDDSRVIVHVFDVLYYDGDSLLDVPFADRKKILKNNFKFTENIKYVEHILVSSPESLIKAVNLMKKLKGSEGAIIKRLDGKYKPGKETDYWIKFRVESPLLLRVIKVNPVKGSTAHNYTVGIDIKNPDKFISKYIMEVNGKPVLRLGNTFNTNIKADVGDVLEVMVEEVWRHKDKNGKIRYSIHKPDVAKKSDRKSTSTVTDLDDIVVSRGVEVKILEEDEVEGIEVRDFPERMQRAFKALMRTKTGFELYENEVIPFDKLLALQERKKEILRLAG